MDLPDGLVSKIKEFGDAKRAHVTARQRVHNERTDKRIAAQGRPKDPSAEGNAEVIARWCEAFLKTNEAQRLWRLIGEDQSLPLFSSRFWLREPCGDDPTVEATLSLFITGIGRYEEKRGNLMGDSAQSWLTPTFLACEFHPVYLRQLRRHLEGPDAFKTLLAEIDRLIAAIAI